MTPCMLIRFVKWDWEEQLLRCGGGAAHPRAQGSEGWPAAVAQEWSGPSRRGVRRSRAEADAPSEPSPRRVTSS